MHTHQNWWIHHPTTNMHNHHHHHLHGEFVSVLRRIIPVHSDALVTAHHLQSSAVNQYQINWIDWTRRKRISLTTFWWKLLNLPVMMSNGDVIFNQNLPDSLLLWIIAVMNWLFPDVVPDLVSGSVNYLLHVWCERSFIFLFFLRFFCFVCFRSRFPWNGDVFETELIHWLLVLVLSFWIN